MVRPTITAVWLTDEQVRLPGAEVMTVMSSLAAATVAANFSCNQASGGGMWGWGQCSRSWHCLQCHAAARKRAGRVEAVSRGPIGSSCLTLYLI